MMFYIESIILAVVYTEPTPLDCLSLSVSYCSTYVMERPVYPSSCIGRISVIQYWNRETTAADSSETGRQEEEAERFISNFS